MSAVSAASAACTPPSMLPLPSVLPLNPPPPLHLPSAPRMGAPPRGRTGGVRGVQLRSVRAAELQQLLVRIVEQELQKVGRVLLLAPRGGRRRRCARLVAALACAAGVRIIVRMIGGRSRAHMLAAFQSARAGLAPAEATSRVRACKSTQRFRSAARLGVPRAALRASVKVLPLAIGHRVSSSLRHETPLCHQSHRPLAVPLEC